MCGGHDASLSDEGAMFQIAVGDCASRVRGADDLSLDILREWVAPDVGLAGCVKVDSAHAGLGSISGAQESRFLGHDLCEVGRTVTQTGS